MCADKKPRILQDRRRNRKPTRWRLVPTLRCNVGCVHCSADVRRAYPTGEGEIEAAAWLEIIQKLAGPLIFTGGEPFLYESLLEVIQGTPQPVRIDTNMTAISQEHIEFLQVAGNVTLNITLPFHQPGWKLKLPTAIKKAVKLSECDNIQTVFLTIGNPGDGVVEAFAEAGVELIVQPNARDDDPFEPEEDIDNVYCERNVRLLGPDGLRYPCWAHMQNKTNPLPLDEPTPFTVDCDRYGCCCYCDRKCLITAK